MLRLSPAAAALDWQCGGGGDRALARVTWTPCAQDHPLHVFLLCVCDSFHCLTVHSYTSPANGGITLFVNLCATTVKFTHEQRNIFRGRRVQVLEYVLNTAAAASAPWTEPRGSERALLVYWRQTNVLCSSLCRHTAVCLLWRVSVRQLNLWSLHTPAITVFSGNCTSCGVV